MRVRLGTLLTQFSIRDLFWLILLVAIASYAYRDRQIMEARVATMKAETDAEKADLRQSQETLDNKIASEAVLQRLALISRSIDSVREYTANCIITERIENELKKHHLAAQIRRPWSSSKSRIARLTFLASNGDKILELTARGTEPSAQWTIKQLGTQLDTANSASLEDDLRNAIGWGVGLDEIFKRFNDRYMREISLKGVKITTHEVTPKGQKRTFLYCDITHDKKRPQFNCYMARLVIDLESRLPVQVAEYDWPEDPSETSPPLIWSVELSDISLKAPFSLFE